MYQIVLYNLSSFETAIYVDNFFEIPHMAYRNINPVN